MTKIVDTRGNNFPLISGLPCTDYNADEEFIFNMNALSLILERTLNPKSKSPYWSTFTN